jgi:hypothetical protein
VVDMNAGFVAAAATLAAADLDTCDQASLTDLAQLALTHRARLDAFDASLAIAAARLDVPAAELLACDGRRRSRDADVIVDRGVVLESMPELHDALAAGAVSAGHVDAIVRVAGRLTDAERPGLVALAPALLDAARSSSVQAFERETRQLATLLSHDQGVGQHERLRRQRSLRRWVDRSGMHHTHVILDPEADARFSAALDAAVGAEALHDDDTGRTFEQLKTDAFLTLTTTPRNTGRRRGEVLVLVLVDEQTLRHGVHDHTVCESNDGQPLAPEAVRRMCCDADIIPVVLNGAGVTLDVGHSQRVATAHQRRALRSMHRTCGFPGCDVRFADCEIHHVIEWIKQRGPTDLDNLLPLCTRHHHTIHEGGWHLTLHADRTIVLRRPDGSIHTDATTSVDVAPNGVSEPTPLQTLLAQSVEQAITRTRSVA